MAFEAQGQEAGRLVSPGGFEFGVQGWTYAEPKPTGITFFLDNTAVVIDQYGRRIRGAMGADLRPVLFADCPPDANREGDVTSRPQFATHAQVIEALRAEGVDWLAYEVRWRDRGGAHRSRGGLTRDQAGAMQGKLIKDEGGATHVTVVRALSCAGWPQIPYDELRKMPELPPTPIEELRKIRDASLRKDALRARREADGARAQEAAALESE